MNDFYRILGVNSSASVSDIRRAYRILARRYHPDVNPGAQTEELFRQIAEAYHVLSDTEQRQRYDALRLHAAASARSAAMRTARAYAAHSVRSASSTESPRTPPESTKTPRERPTAQPKPQASPRRSDPTISRSPTGRFTIRRMLSGLAQRVLPARAPLVYIAELELTVPEAIRGIRKTIEVRAENEVRALPVHIPAGCLPDQVIKLRSKKRPNELIIVIIRHAPHPTFSLSRRGLTMEVPLTVHEALAEGSITVPTLTTPISVRIPRGTQSGSELRVPGKGIPLSLDPRTRGDLYLRFRIVVPTSADAAQLAANLEPHYATPVRGELQARLREIAVSEKRRSTG